MTSGSFAMEELLTYLFRGAVASVPKFKYGVRRHQGGLVDVASKQNFCSFMKVNVQQFSDMSSFILQENAEETKAGKKAKKLFTEWDKDVRSLNAFRPWSRVLYRLLRFSLATSAVKSVREETKLLREKRESRRWHEARHHGGRVPRHLFIERVFLKYLFAIPPRVALRLCLSRKGV